MHFQLSVESAFASCSVILKFSQPDNIGSRCTGVSKVRYANFEHSNCVLARHYEG